MAVVKLNLCIFLQNEGKRYLIYFYISARNNCAQVKPRYANCACKCVFACFCASKKFLHFNSKRRKQTCRHGNDKLGRM